MTSSPPPAPGRIQAVLQPSPTSPRLILTHLAYPTTTTEYLISMRAAAITRHELTWEEADPHLYTTPRDRVPCIEGAGVVLYAPEGAASAVGDNVFFTLPAGATGALRQVATVPTDAAARKPPHLSWAQAAAAPLSALTAWQGLFEHGPLTAPEANTRTGDAVDEADTGAGTGAGTDPASTNPNTNPVSTADPGGNASTDITTTPRTTDTDTANTTNTDTKPSADANANLRVLVTGANGSVGDWAVKLASRAGATVVGVCRSSFDTVAAAGASSAIPPDLLPQWVSDAENRVDVVLDTVGGDMGVLWAALKPGGKLLAVGPTQPVKPEDEDETKSGEWYVVHPSSTQLAAIARMMEEDPELVPQVDEVFHLREYADAFRKVEGRTKGKVVVLLD